MVELVTYSPALKGELLAVWRDASRAAWPIMPELWEAHTACDASFRPQDCVMARVDGRVAGFVVAKRFRDNDPRMARFAETGHVSLLAVASEFQRQGLGSRLLRRAEDALRAEGCARVGLGGSFHHVLAGVPAALDGALGFFERRGYVAGESVYDVRRDLAVAPALPEAPPAPGFSVRPYRPDERDRLVAFMWEAFPGRWAWDLTRFLEAGGAIETVMGVFEGETPCGFAWLHPPGSVGALRWAGLVPGVAALGPIGVSARVRGHGLGLALMVGGLDWLRAHGASETVIDWTTLLEFYGRCGFAPWLGYTLAGKPLTAD